MVSRKEYWFVVIIASLALGIAITSWIIEVNNSSPQASTMIHHIAKESMAMLPYLVGIVAALLALLAFKDFGKRSRQGVRS